MELEVMLKLSERVEKMWGKVWILVEKQSLDGMATKSILYGFESWVLRAKERRKVKVFYTKY